MSDLFIRTEGRAGRITLTRDGALNALDHQMCRDIDAALFGWATDPAVALVLIDSAGERAFCAGGDLRDMYQTGKAGDFAYGRRFWTDEYRMNARLAAYPKPVVTFLKGFVLGGGVGLGCHAAERIVGTSSRIAMPEATVGLIPDVGGTSLLARAPGHLGEYLGLTGTRMKAADAIHAGFADHFIPEDGWEALKSTLCATGSTAAIAKAARKPGDSRLAGEQALIDATFGAGDLAGIRKALEEDASDPLLAEALTAMDRNAPLAMACTLQILDQLRGGDSSVPAALSLEYRYSFRAAEQGDFLEGIRARIIDRDNRPVWAHRRDVPARDVAAMTAPLGAEELALA